MSMENVSTRDFSGRSTIAGLFQDRAQAEEAIRALHQAGFKGDQIGIAMRDRTAQGELVRETGSQAAEGAVSGAVGGGLLGGLVGLLVGIGALAIPGIGPVVAGGALATAFGLGGGTAVAGAGIGAAAGGLLGALVGLGIPEEEARHFETGFQAGGVLVTVNAKNRAMEALSILERYNADTGPGSLGATRRSETASAEGAAVGTAGGAVAGGVAGAAIGTAVAGPLGTLPGAVIGGVTGAATGGAVGAAAGADWGDVEPEFRSNWEQSKYRQNYKWEQVSPAYRYGYESYYKPDYQNQNWNQARPNLQSGWNQSWGNYNEYEDAVRYGYEQGRQRSTRSSSTGNTGSTGSTSSSSSSTGTSGSSNFGTQNRNSGNR